MKLLSIILLVVTMQVSANDQCAYVSTEAAQKTVDSIAEITDSTATMVSHSTSTRSMDIYTSVVRNTPYLVFVTLENNGNGCEVDKVTAKKIDYKI